jgi:AraC-type DNA-binding domain-containing proteins
MTTSRRIPRVEDNDSDGAALHTPIVRFRRLLEIYAPHDGVFDIAVKGAHTVRRSRASDELNHIVQDASLCLVAQGAKRVMLGREAYEYDATKMVVFSIDVPVASQLTRASAAQPFLCLKIDLDLKRVGELALKVFPDGLPRSDDSSAICIAPMDGKIVEAGIRLMEALADPGDIKWVAPLVVDEMIIRLLRSPIGPALASIAVKDAGISGIARAVSWLQGNYAKPIQVDQLAGIAHMSASSFHQHFKAVTSMSPLQYQKTLRLQEARRLMLSKMLDAGDACQLVGYASASQFSREYSRFFGAAPTKDVMRLRERLRISGGQQGAN